MRPDFLHFLVLAQTSNATPKTAPGRTTFRTDRKPVSHVKTFGCPARINKGCIPTGRDPAGRNVVDVTEQAIFTIMDTGYWQTADNPVSVYPSDGKRRESVMAIPSDGAEPCSPVGNDFGEKFY